MKLAGGRRRKRLTQIEQLQREKQLLARRVRQVLEVVKLRERKVPDSKLEVG